MVQFHSPLVRTVNHHRLKATKKKEEREQISSCNYLSWPRWLQVNNMLCCSNTCPVLILFFLFVCFLLIKKISLIMNKFLWISIKAERWCHAAACPVVCLPVPHVSTCCVSMLFPPCPDSPDSAVWVLSPTGKTPKSRSTKQNWRILGITHVWWRTRWERTTPLAL